jgi:uncharacterized protein
MTVPRDAMMLRVFIGEDAKLKRQPLKAREAHLAGATVLRGLIGFGNSSRLHTWKILRLYEDLPLIVEIVDTEEKIKAFLPTLDAMMPTGVDNPGKGPGSAIRGGRQARARLTGTRHRLRAAICVIVADAAWGNRACTKFRENGP